MKKFEWKIPGLCLLFFFILPCLGFGDETSRFIKVLEYIHHATSPAQNPREGMIKDYLVLLKLKSIDFAVVKDNPYYHEFLTL
ncbi:MAG: hypothetical protein JXJ04_09955, partial [Spirochaetales bacterium]|nr:hypothetical protein [Spirochaetales bacterium]